MSVMLKFLQPTPWKIALTFVLFFTASLLWRIFVTARIMDVSPFGFPFQFFVTWGPCPPGEDCSSFNGLFLLFDLLAWYVIGAWALNRFRKQ